MSLADVLTLLRFPLSLSLLFLCPFRLPFTVVYLACGLTDVLDGLAARKISGATRRGARLDSLADLVFLLVCLYKLAPVLSLPAWIWGWAACIGLMKIAFALLRKRRQGSLAFPHTLPNKATGLLLFLLPLLPQGTEIYFSLFLCAAATWAALDEGRKGRNSNEEESNL